MSRSSSDIFDGLDVVLVLPVYVSSEAMAGRRAHAWWLLVTGDR